MWSGLDKNARIGVLIAASVLFILTFVALFLVFSGEKSNLFRNLDEKEASNVILALEEMKIPYELSKGGKDISVDEAVVEQVRLKLVGKGVRIQTGEGFELFDDADIGMTEYSQKINYLRAMQGELARSIMLIDGIKYARVHLVLPETSVFKQNKQVPTASVTLIPEAGTQLKEDQIIGIQRMLAAATPGVSQENVTVLDNNGITLSNADYETNKEQITSMLLKKKHEAESYLEAKVVEILSRTFGEGQSVTTISVELVVDKVHRKEEIVLPQNSKADGLIRKRETTSGEKKEKAKNNNNSVEIEYQLSKRIEDVVSMPGSISRISVGVIVPEKTGEDKVNNLRKIISMAVGLDINRGDDIAIYPMKMDLFGKVKDEKLTQNLLPPDDNASVNNKQTELAADSNKRLISYNQLIYIAAGFMFLALVLIFSGLLKRGRNSKNNQSNMTIQEKEKLLSDLKTWVKEGAV